MYNTDGRTINIGIDNKGQAVGISNPDEVMARMGNMIRDGIVRHGVSSVPATDEAIRQMLHESDGMAFDKSRCLN